LSRQIAGTFEDNALSPNFECALFSSGRDNVLSREQFSISAGKSSFIEDKERLPGRAGGFRD
jgi:hypothetical protein